MQTCHLAMFRGWLPIIRRIMNWPSNICRMDCMSWKKWMKNRRWIIIILWLISIPYWPKCTKNRNFIIKLWRLPAIHWSMKPGCLIKIVVRLFRSYGHNIVWTKKRGWWSNLRPSMKRTSGLIFFLLPWLYWRWLRLFCCWYVIVPVSVFMRGCCRLPSWNNRKRNWRLNCRRQNWKRENANFKPWCMRHNSVKCSIILRAWR